MEKPRTIRDYAALGICIAFALGGIWLFFRYLLGIVLPFFFGWLLALSVRPLAKKVGEGTRIPCRFLRLAFVMVSFTLLGVGVYFLGTRLTRELRQLVEDISAPNAVRWPPFVSHILEVVSKGGEGEVGSYLTQALSGMVESLTRFLPTLLGRLVSAVPKVVISLLMVLISAVYFCLDLETVHTTCIKMLPEKMREWALRAKHGILHVGGTYLKSYLILMGITLVILLVGFLFIGVEYALLLAFIISLVDLFHVLGVGTVLAPWALWCFLTGDVGRGVALLILWGVAFLVRQFAEPRLVGDSLGVHPLLTLFAMYAGLSLGSVLGMLLLPALCVPLVSFLKRKEKSP